ncbi:MAG: hypothetical protein WAW96_03360 [Alphaproteobacteria bacterium]
MDSLIRSFFERAPADCGRIYNERSLQLELAYCFRLHGASVEFERPLKVPRPTASTCRPKSNLDLFVRNNDQSFAIELKVPLNGRHPETLYDFCADLEFVESIVGARLADRGFCLLVTDDGAFWSDSGRGSPIHDLFRRSGTILTGAVRKPTGSKDTTVVISGQYRPVELWRDVPDSRLMSGAKYLLLEIK